MSKLSKITEEPNRLRRQVSKYKKLFFLALILWVLFYLSGFLTGWWVVKGTLGVFPAPDINTRLLVIAPHPDDESVMAGGLIQKTLEKGGQVRIIYLTSGDGSRATIVQDSKKIDLSPGEFIALGEERIKEASAAAQILGVARANVYFLGFPDGGLTKIYNRNFNAADGVGSSTTTKVNYVPYPEAYHPGQTYLGTNLVEDVRTIVKSFSPNMVVTGHPRDQHPDHRIAYTIIEKIKADLPQNCKIYGSLVHYQGYPNPGGYLFPPKKLFGGDWLNLEQTPAEQVKDRQAVEAHQSQYRKAQDKVMFDRLTARNEIFELE